MRTKKTPKSQKLKPSLFEKLKDIYGHVRFNLQYCIGFLKWEGFFWRYFLVGLPKIRRDDGTFQHLNQIQVQKVTNSYMTRVFKGPNKTPFHGSQRDQEKKQLSSNSQMVIQHFSSLFTHMRVNMFIFV